MYAAFVEAHSKELANPLRDVEVRKVASGLTTLANEKQREARDKASGKKKKAAKPVLGSVKAIGKCVSEPKARTGPPHFWILTQVVQGPIQTCTRKHWMTLVTMRTTSCETRRPPRLTRRFSSHVLNNTYVTRTHFVRPFALFAVSIHLLLYVTMNFRSFRCYRSFSATVASRAYRGAYSSLTACFDSEISILTAHLRPMMRRGCTHQRSLLEYK